MAYFFFGTLMDRDVLEHVLDRAVGECELISARLAGFRRVRTAEEVYPTLVPHSGGVVEGVLLRRAAPRDDVRIRHFEEEEYVERRLPVHLTDGCRLEARVFFAHDDLGPTDEPWDIAAWAREHKPHFLELCREWMRDCPA